MKRPHVLLALSALTVLACAACNSSPGRPGTGSEVIPPDQVVEFNVLYGQNCAGCHGTSGNGGATIALRDPVFLTIADDAVIRRTAANGVRGTSMPAFAQSAGGMLTDKQIEALVAGIRSWAKSGILNNVIPPRLLAIRNVVRKHIELIVPLVTEWMAAEGTRPARS